MKALEPDPLDFFGQLLAAGDVAMPKLIERVQSVIDGGSKVTRHFKCPHCSHQGTVEIEGADIKEARQLIEMFAGMQIKAAQANKDSDGSAKALKLIHDHSEMTSLELAEYITRLKRELDAA